MMTQQLEVSILAAPLAGMDRRALSQAWYSALRLAPKARRISPEGACPHRETGVRVRASSPAASETVRHASVEARITPLVCARRTPLGFDEGSQALRRPRSRTLAERIERVFADLRSHPKRATFSMGRGNARVHVILQTAGERTTLLALCPPELRGVVGRALAQARLALAQRGIGVEMRALGDRRCS